jgi:hypothetical protein
VNEVEVSSGEVVRWRKRSAGCDKWEEIFWWGRKSKVKRLGRIRPRTLTRGRPGVQAKHGRQMLPDGRRPASMDGMTR